METLVPRDDSLEGFLEMTLKQGVSMESAPDRNITNTVINALFLVQVQQQRYMHIALGALSMALSLWVVSRIWFDSWRASKMQVKLRPSKFSFLTELHPAESFPLLLAFVSFAQALTFVVIQALTLNTIFVNHCSVTSQIIFPAIFALPYMHLVWGFEMTVRSLKRNPFKARGKWANIICIVAFVTLLVATWIPAHIWPMKMKCLGDIIWRPFRNVRMGAIISGSLIFAFLTMGAIIGIQLYNTKSIEPHERISGSRMFYYLMGSAILQVFVFPFFIQGAIMKFDPDVSSSRVAEFILFTMGSFLALLHLILRANASLTAIKPKSAPWQRKSRFRLFGPSDLELITISAPLDLINDSYNPDEKAEDAYAAKIMSPPPSISTFNSQFASPDRQTRWPLPEERLPSPRVLVKSPKTKTPQISSPIKSHTRNKPSYSVFPNEGVDDIIRLPATTYTPPSSSTSRRAPSLAVEGRSSATILTSPSVTDVSRTSVHADDLLPPNHPWMESSHRRDGSTDSTATVQIGLRLSNVAAALATTSLASIIETSPNSSNVPEASQRGSISVPSQQPERRPSDTPPSPISKARSDRSPTKQDSRSKDSRQKPELARLEIARGSISVRPPAVHSPPSRAQRLYEPPRLTPSVDDRLDGFF